MYKAFLFLFFVSLISLQAKQKDTLQIIAKNIAIEDSIIKANGDVLIFSPMYYISAKKVIYDKKEQKLELFGNVNISKNNEAIAISEYTLLDLKNEVNVATPVLLIEQKSEIWIDAKEIRKEKNTHYFKNATLSSCDCYNPDWSVGFSSGDFNTSKQWINSYNNTIYIKDIPAWYFLAFAAPYLPAQHLLVSYLVLNSPYLGFSTNNNRSSGFLIPNIGYSNKQGYLYEQPIYYAAKKNYDIEYIPKIRSNRGFGHELKYRYKDSVYSQLNISTGIFKEKDEYFNEHNLINKRHFGWNLDYTRKNIFSNDNFEDGVIIQLQDMNDIEYKNTLYKQKTVSSDKIINSKVSYFYNSDNYYSDFRLIKYDNIFTNNNTVVYQTLPEIQIHKYLKKVPFFDGISSSFDIKFERKSADKLVSADRSDILLPIKYSTSFFNKYLDMTFTEKIQFKNIDYFNDESNNKDANYLINTHVLNFSIYLLKSYSTFIHTINLQSTITKNNTIYEKGDLFGINNSNNDLASFTNEKNLDNFNISLNQNFYLKNKFNFLNHKMSQSIVKNKEKNILGDLANEFTFNFSKGSLSNRIVFNHEENLIIKSTVAFKYKNDDFINNINYSYLKNKENINEKYKDIKADKSISVEVSNKFFKYYTLKYKEQYNITDRNVNSREYSLNINKKCWDFNIRLEDKLVASATTNQNAIRQNIIYGTISFKPLLTLQQKYIQNEKEE